MLHTIDLSIRQYGECNKGTGWEEDCHLGATSTRSRIPPSARFLPCLSLSFSVKDTPGSVPNLELGPPEGIWQELINTGGRESHKPESINAYTGTHTHERTQAVDKRLDSLRHFQEKIYPGVIGRNEKEIDSKVDKARGPRRHD